MSRVQSASSPPLLLAFMFISMALAIPIIPLAETVLISGTGFFVLGANQVWKSCYEVLGSSGLKKLLVKAVAMTREGTRRFLGVGVHGHVLFA